MSLLRANPSVRDARSYLQVFGGPKPTISEPSLPRSSDRALDVSTTKSTAVQIRQDDLSHPKPSLVTDILNPVQRRTALVKLQGPFTEVQLDSIARGLLYLEKLGLVSVIVVENQDLVRGSERERIDIIEDTMRVVSALEKHGAQARPILSTVVRLGPHPDENDIEQRDHCTPEAHTFPSDLLTIRSSLRAGEIPVLPPFAMDSQCRSVRVDANEVLGALARGMVEAADHFRELEASTSADVLDEVDLTPMRLMIINREGGVPSYARSGHPHLLVNLTSEYNHIVDNYRPAWKVSHPTALSNLSLARTCLAYMPSTSSAIMVSHRSPSSLIGNLITNKPAVSSSLPHALLQGNRKLTPHTPTILRRGLPIRVVHKLADIDRAKMTYLLEKSFGRTLDQAAFYTRLGKVLDSVIIAGDYVGAAIVTNEPNPANPSSPISYLDKFSVLPEHQGDGTVDFLWVALHDESYGLGHSSSVNPNGGREGKGEGRDLVWRSRANNPVNKWYFERSSGHLRSGEWVMFWCDAEKRVRAEAAQRGSEGLSYVEYWEEGRLAQWSDVVMKISSVWR